VKNMKEYVDFKLVGYKPKTNVYHVVTKSTGDILGVIKWHFPWRQYCFFPFGDVVWSHGCLKQVMDFIKKLMERRKIGVTKIKKCDIHNVGKLARTHVKCSDCEEYFDIPMTRDWMWVTLNNEPVCDGCAKIATTFI